MQHITPLRQLLEQSDFGTEAAPVLPRYQFGPLRHHKTITLPHAISAVMPQVARELRVLRKHVQQLEMENDLLKQAALIVGQK